MNQNVVDFHTVINDDCFRIFQNLDSNERLVFDETTMVSDSVTTVSGFNCNEIDDFKLLVQQLHTQLLMLQNDVHIDLNANPTLISEDDLNKLFDKLEDCVEMHDPKLLRLDTLRNKQCEDYDFDEEVEFCRRVAENKGRFCYFYFAFFNLNVARAGGSPKLGCLVHDGFKGL